MNKPRICPVCGYQLLDNETVCIICGKKFDNNTSVENNNTYSYNNTSQSSQSIPSSRYKSETVRTYSSGIRQPQYTSTLNQGFETNVSQSKTFNTQTTKKKMNPILKVFLIIFGIQFILPFIMGIIFVIFALVQVNSIQDKMDVLINANVETIEIEELDIKQSDCTTLAPMTNYSDIDNAYVSSDGILCLEFEKLDYDITAFISNKYWNNGGTINNNYFYTSDDDYHIGIELYAGGNYENEIDIIDYDNSDLGFDLNIERLEDIELGHDVFRTYRSNATYYFICEIDSDCYFVCEVTRYDSEDDLEDIFPLVAIKTY